MWCFEQLSHPVSTSLTSKAQAQKNDPHFLLCKHVAMEIRFHTLTSFVSCDCNGKHFASCECGGLNCSRNVILFSGQIFLTLSWRKKILADVKLMVLGLPLLVHSKHHGWRRTMSSARHQKWSHRPHRRLPLTHQRTQKRKHVRGRSPLWHPQHPLYQQNLFQTPQLFHLLRQVSGAQFSLSLNVFPKVSNYYHLHYITCQSMFSPKLQSRNFLSFFGLLGF